MGLFYSPFSVHKNVDGKRRILLYFYSTLLASLGMMVIIFCFSAADGEASSAVSQGFTLQLLRFLQWISAGHFTISSMQDWMMATGFSIRKLAHFMEYAMLGFLLQSHMHSRLYCKGQEREIGEKLTFPWKFLLLGILICVCYAISDEIHQYFVPERACRAFDVMIDSCGVLFGSLIFHRIFRACLDGLLRKG